MNWCWVDGDVNYEILRAGYVRYSNFDCTGSICEVPGTIAGLNLGLPVNESTPEITCTRLDLL